MLSMAQFNRSDEWPSWIVNALTKALSLVASQFILVQTDNTHVQVPAGADDQATVLAIKGLWRWVEAPITIAHPGGAAGAYPIFATAKNNNITNVPDPFTDHTDYSFGLVIESPGATPAIVAGAVDVYRHVGDAIWDGAKITRIDQWAPQTPLHAARHAASGPDAISPSSIGAVASGDAHTLQTGDLVASGATSRAGAVLCDGTAYSRTDPLYAPLFAKIGTRYGAGNGSTTFNVPDFRDKQIVGASVTRALGSTGGAETMKLAAANLPAHYHGYSGTTQGMNAGNPHGHSPSVRGQFLQTDQTPVGGVDVQSNVGSTLVPAAFNWGAGGMNNADIDHGHGYGGNTDNGNGLAATPFSLRDPYVTANVFILL